MLPLFSEPFISVFTTHADNPSTQAGFEFTSFASIHTESQHVPSTTITKRPNLYATFYRLL
jgi:hypothetical protein